VADEPRGKLPTLEVALLGTLAMASAICVRMWLIMSDIREALNDPNAMAFIITDNGIKSDNAKSETMLNHARDGFADTERVVALFSVALALVAIALFVRIYKADATRPAVKQALHTKRKRPASR
jgi:type IV secretory pathway TrbD component